MSLKPEHYLSACAASQMLEVVPALEGTYAGGTAGTVGALLMMAVQDLSGRAEREAAEWERLRAIYAAAGEPEPADLGMARAGLKAMHERAEKAKDVDVLRAILDHLVITTEAERLTLPV
ncbi:MAG: hypothetical protein WA979_09220 [Pacificimonas sp.]